MSGLVIAGDQITGTITMNKLDGTYWKVSLLHILETQFIER